MSQFDCIRVVSATRPGYGVGLPVIHLHGWFSLSQIEEIDAAKLGFYIDDRHLLSRGNERYTETFILQAGMFGREWEDIKPITPLEGAGPDEIWDDEELSQEDINGWWDDNPNHPSDRTTNTDNYPEDTQVVDA